jgi:hypothetical protein
MRIRERQKRGLVDHTGYTPVLWGEALIKPLDALDRREFNSFIEARARIMELLPVWSGLRIWDM